MPYTLRSLSLLCATAALLISTVLHADDSAPTANPDAKPTITSNSADAAWSDDNTNAEGSSAAVEAAADSDTDSNDSHDQAHEMLSNNPLDAFPKADEGFTRHVIHLPIGNYENDLKVELLPGKVIEVDCNTHVLIGQLTEHTLDGWGYSYYVLPTVEGPVSTKIACPDDTLSPRFVPINSSAGSLLHYNSQLPIVVYLPDGVELRWRTWMATPVNGAAVE